MDANNFACTISKELGLVPHNVTIASIPGAPKGMANVFVNPLLSTITATPKAVEILTDDELCAVITHELGHSYNHHVEKRLVIDGVSFVLSGINLFLPLPIWKKVLIQVGLTVAELGVKYKMFHDQEYEADQLSFRYSLNKQLASALRKLDAANVSFKSTNPVMAAIGSITHPSTDERVKRLNVPVINR
jgi:Zn-dependent protease with chaperone function